MHIREILYYSVICLSLPGTSLAVDDANDKARLTLGVPVYVGHPDDRSGGRDWNEGWFNNEGVMIDATWPAWDISSVTKVRAGVTGGFFDNSIYKTSVFLGGDLEIETKATQNLYLSVGTYAGAITGYEYDVSPAIAPYIGTSYSVTDDVEIGARGFWLPSKTIAGSDLAESDAYVATVTIGTRF